MSQSPARSGLSGKRVVLFLEQLDDVLREAHRTSRLELLAGRVEQALHLGLAARS